MRGEGEGEKILKSSWFFQRSAPQTNSEISYVGAQERSTAGMPSTYVQGLCCEGKDLKVRFCGQIQPSQTNSLLYGYLIFECLFWPQQRGIMKVLDFVNSSSLPSSYVTKYLLFSQIMDSLPCSLPCFYFYFSSLSSIERPFKISTAQTRSMDILKQLYTVPFPSCVEYSPW